MNAPRGTRRMAKIGCQTYTWEMLGAQWQGRVDDILDAVAAAGYRGIEITNAMIGEYAERPEAFAEALRTRELTMPAFGFGAPSGFTDPGARAIERAGAEQAMRFVAAFPGSLLVLGGASAFNEGSRAVAIEAAASFYNQVGQIGRRAGVPVAFHPSTHHGSILVTADDYDRIMRLTDPELVRWNPDSGHIVRGGQDLPATLRRYAARICHVHLKDLDRNGAWQPMGHGVCDMPPIITLLRDELQYEGWFVLEEESDAARADPVAAIRDNREYLRPILG